MSKQIDVKSQAKRYHHSYRRAASIATLLPATTPSSARISSPLVSGWGYWEGLVDAIVHQQGIGGRE
ncbi:hypothetical protein FRC10_001193 [Ceratobasidium sp. 414]|nr:hypothetical protein FRC10_001193 [Ceratobasidium sp. 414]